uniref:Uncharacterized protein n=1 Tax=Ditylenchus dipsaci TaxID=166011 RepID=A0A915DCM8_9BILA
MQCSLNWQETVCGVTNALDGSEDGIIHCFKEDGPVPSGRAKLCLAREEKEMAVFFQELNPSEEEEKDMNDSDVFYRVLKCIDLSYFAIKNVRKIMYPM